MSVLVKNDVYGKLKELYAQKPSYQYIFVGHSLGGAIASIFAQDVVKDAVIKKTNSSPLLITYGQPRTGNFVYANSSFINVPRTFRIVRHADPVPNVPPCEEKK